MSSRRTPWRRWVTAAASLSLALSLAGAGYATAAPTKPTPAPLAPTDLATFYDSDIHADGIIYYNVVAGFEDVRTKHPAIMKQNLDTVVSLNQSAKDNPPLIQRALADEHDDLLVTMSDALGSDLGRMFREALAADRLPKTQALLSGNLARGGGVASSTFVEKFVFNYPRPFVVAPQRIKQYHRPGEEGPYDESRLSTAFPSGHTNQATWKATMWAMMVPEFGQALVARAQEVGYNRLVMGVHYPLDVIGGRMTGQAAAADRWSDQRFRSLIKAAGAEIRAELQWRCGAELAACIAKDTPYLGTAQQISETYDERMNYGFPRIAASDAPMIVPAKAESLLAASHPTLSAAQREQLIRLTAYPSGYPLDDQSARGSWQRINLARALAAEYSISPSGTLTLN